MRRGAHDPLGLDDTQHKPGARGAILSLSQPEGLPGLGQHRRQHREALLGQHQIAEPVDRGKRRGQPLQHDADLPAPARQSRPRPEPERRQAHRRMAFFLGERNRRAWRRPELVKRLQIERGIGGPDGIGHKKEEKNNGARPHHEPSLPVFPVRGE